MTALIAVDLLDKSVLVSKVLEDVDNGTHDAETEKGGFQPFIVSPRTNQIIASSQGWAGDDISDHVTFEIPMSDPEVFGMTRRWLKASVKGDDDVWEIKALFMLVVSVWSDEDEIYNSYQIFIPITYEYLVSFASFCREGEVNGCIIPNFERITVKICMEMEFARFDDISSVAQTILDDKDFIGEDKVYVMNHKTRVIRASFESGSVGLSIDDLVSMSPAMAGETGEGILSLAYGGCEGNLWANIPWPSYDLMEKYDMKGHFSCVSVNNEAWLIGVGMKNEMAELFLPCPNTPSACSINNAEIVGSYLKTRIMEADTDEEVQEIIDAIEADFNGFLGVSSSYDISHFKPTIFHECSGHVFTCHHQDADMEHFWEYHSIYHNLSLQEATDDYLSMLKVSHSNVGGGWTTMNVRHDIDEVVQEYAVYVQSTEEIVIAVSFENVIFHKTPYITIDHPEPNVIAIHKQVIGEVSTGLSVDFSHTLDLINQGRQNHLFIEPFVIDHGDQKIVASGSDTLRGQSIHDVFVTDVESDIIKDKSFFFGGSDTESIDYLNANDMFQYTDHARAFTDLDRRIYFGAEHANVFMVKK
eukprot:TRINITY_DN391313_c0_g1_i2.p1 TRINITY_DN391313_c0_g1~~TRINITY_DN391313_c0_g1_i2.p1  ORF type:complete len:609 (+),score=163.32 TRINITY_DN391313_c0_g1_i2:71-1828(+)